MIASGTAIVDCAFVAFAAAMPPITNAKELEAIVTFVLFAVQLLLGKELGLVANNVRVMQAQI